MSETMRKMSTLKFPKVPERYELIDAKARKDIESLKQTTGVLESIQSDVSTLKDTSSNHSDRLDEVEGYFDGGSTHSGSIVSFDSLVAGNAVEVTSVLGLKQSGSGDPYPAGGGKNLIDMAQMTGNNASIDVEHFDHGIRVYSTTAGTYRRAQIGDITLRAGVNYTISAEVTAMPGGYARVGFVDQQSNAVISRIVFSKAEKKTTTFSVSEDTVAYFGAWCSWDTSIAGDATYTNIQVEIGDVATDYAPPSNIRPITGYDALELNHTGKNLVEKVVYGYIAAGSTEPNFNVDNDSVSAVVHVVKGQRYKISCAVPFDRLTVAKAETTEFAAQQKLTNAKDFPISGLAFTAEFTGIAVVYLKSRKDESVKDSLQIELGSTATPYEPYQGKLHTVKIGQTVYDGTMNWNTGELTVDKVMVTLDGANQKATLMNANSNYVQVKLGDYLPDAIKQAGNGNLICSHLPEQYGLYSDFPYPHVFLDVIDTPYIRAYFSTTLASTVNEVNAYLTAQYAAGTPIQVVYKLATPKVIQLTPTQIKTLQGTNTFYGDGTLSVDTKGEMLGVTDRVESIEQSLFDTKKYEYTGSVVQFDAPLEGSPMEAVTEILPRQEGSGDPYPAGGGKNLCNPDEFVLGDMMDGYVDTGSSTINYISGYVTVLPNTTYTRSSNCVTGSREIAFFDADKNYLSRVFGDTFTTPDGCYFVRLEWETTYPLNESWFQLELGSVATEYQPYSNIRPISGYDALNLNAAGKNLIPYYDFSSGYTNNGITATINNDKSITFSGIATGDTYFYLSRYSTTADTGYDLPSGEYILSGCPAGGASGVYGLTASVYKDGVWYSGASDFGSGERLTVPAACRVNMYIRFGAGVNANGMTFYPMFRPASIDDVTYEAPGKVYTVQIGQTVYGGKFDWLTGKLTKNVGNITLDGSQGVVSSWPGEHGNIIVAYSVPDALTLSPASKSDLLFSDKLKAEIADDQHLFESHINSISMSGSSGCIAVCIRGITTLSDMNTWLSQNPVECVYPLAEPIEIQLDKHELTTIRGLNTVYCNAGETSISVRKDIFSLLGYLTQKNKELTDTIKELQS